MSLLASATTQEEKLHYLFNLRFVKEGWTLEQRRTYLDWLRRARFEFNGAQSLPTALNYIRAEVQTALSTAERLALADALAALDKPSISPPAPASNRPFVKAWVMQDFIDGHTDSRPNRDLARGQRLFAEAGCVPCHRFGQSGGVVGPDLTSVSSRFDRRALLESILEPSRTVAEPYRNVTVTTRSDIIMEGRVVAEDAGSITLATNPVDPDRRQRLAKADIVSQRVSTVSPMPEGLLNTLTREEVFDLLAW